MGTQTKFTAETRTKILQALQVGASRQTAAAIAGVDPAQITRWYQKGHAAAAGTSFREFYEAMLEAEASPRMRALGIIYKELPDNPSLAWKYIERREPGYEPPVLNAPAPAAGPVIINLAFADGRSAQPAWIDVEVVEDAEESPAIGDGGGAEAGADPA